MVAPAAASQDKSVKVLPLVELQQYCSLSQSDGTPETHTRTRLSRSEEKRLQELGFLETRGMAILSDLEPFDLCALPSAQLGVNSSAADKSKRVPTPDINMYQAAQQLASPLLHRRTCMQGSAGLRPSESHLRTSSGEGT